MRILIVDDNEINRKQTERLVCQCIVPAIIVGNVCGKTEAKKWLQTNEKPDLIICETTFNDGTIFDLAEEINFKCPLILITDQKNHALKAFRLNTIAYIIKPVSIKSVKEAIDKFFIFKNIFQSSIVKNRFGVSLGNKIHHIETDDIAFFLAEDKTVYLHAKNGARYVVDYTLDMLESLLNANLFFRINRQIVAKIDAIQSIRKHENRRLQLSFKHGETLYNFIVSRSKVKNFKEWIGH